MRPRPAPPLLFVHGAWHGAWCWDDHFLKFFTDRGFACYALNLRGHGLSGGARDVRFCRIRHFVEDLGEAIAQIGAKPILIGHSLGGFIVQKYLERETAELGVLLASIPPDGASRMLKRIMKAQPLDLLRSNLVFSLRPLFSSAAKVRKSMFSDSTPDKIVERCRERLQDDVIVGFLDYLFLDLVNVPQISTKILVFGAAEDRMIGPDDLKVSGTAYGQTPIVIPGVGHDMMLDLNWRRAAKEVAAQIDMHLDFRIKNGVQFGRVA
jgi:pimeloyl-ACP methyl ester carboxylesterase